MNRKDNIEISKAEDFLQSVDLTQLGIIAADSRE
jgi:hypothetical protein